MSLCPSSQHSLLILSQDRILWHELLARANNGSIAEFVITESMDLGLVAHVSCQIQTEVLPYLWAMPVCQGCFALVLLQTPESILTTQGL